MAPMKSALLQVATSCQRWRKIKAKAIHLSEAISVYGCPVDASGLVMQEVRKKSAYIPRHLAVASKMVHQCTSPLWNICNFQVKNTSLILFPGQLKSTLVPFFWQNEIRGQAHVNIATYTTYSYSHSLQISGVHVQRPIAKAVQDPFGAVWIVRVPQELLTGEASWQVS